MVKWVGLTRRCGSCCGCIWCRWRRCWPPSRARRRRSLVRLRLRRRRRSHTDHHLHRCTVCTKTFSSGSPLVRPHQTESAGFLFSVDPSVSNAPSLLFPFFHPSLALLQRHPTSFLPPVHVLPLSFLPLQMLIFSSFHTSPLNASPVFPLSEGTKLRSRCIHSFHRKKEDVGEEEEEEELTQHVQSGLGLLLPDHSQSAAVPLERGDLRLQEGHLVGDGWRGRGCVRGRGSR